MRRFTVDLRRARTAMRMLHEAGFPKVKVLSVEDTALGRWEITFTDGSVIRTVVL